MHSALRDPLLLFFVGHVSACACVMSCPVPERERGMEGDLALVESTASFDLRQTSGERIEHHPSVVPPGGGFAPHIDLLSTCIHTGGDAEGLGPTTPCVAVGEVHQSHPSPPWLMFDLPPGPGKHRLADLHARICENTPWEADAGGRLCADVLDGEVDVHEVAPPCERGLCGRLHADLTIPKPKNTPSLPYPYGSAHLFHRNEMVDKPCTGWGAPSMTPMR